MCFLLRNRLNLIRLLKDRPVWDAVCHVEGPNLPHIILMACCQAPGEPLEPRTHRCPNHLPPDTSKQVAMVSHQPILPQGRAFPWPPRDKAVQIAYTQTQNQVVSIYSCLYSFNKASYYGIFNTQELGLPKQQSSDNAMSVLWEAETTGTLILYNSGSHSHRHAQNCTRPGPTCLLKGTD